MNLRQMEYMVAVDSFRHFVRAAEHCHVTQPTLSMMIQRAEEELGVKIFDRSQKPVRPTAIGEKLIEEARAILKRVKGLKQIVEDMQHGLTGELRLGIIPTLAPYLVPLFIGAFTRNYPKVKLKIVEELTEGIIEKLQKDQLDIGLLVTPVSEPRIVAFPLFYEEFFVYSTHEYAKTYLLPEDIEVNELLLLEEGHCFRSQIMNLCKLRNRASLPFQYEAGSVETLKLLVEHDQGVTILPELSALYMSPNQYKKIRRFQPPVPVREVSLVTHQDYVKQRMRQSLQAEILASIPPQVRNRRGVNLVEI